MTAIPQYEQKVNYSREPSEYYKGGANADAFGASIASAAEKLGETSAWFTQTMVNMHNQIQEMNARELANYIDFLEKTDLQNPENGYYSKLGKDAMTNPDDPNSGAAGVINNIEKKINQKQQLLGLTWGRGQQAAESVKLKKLNMLYSGAVSHELKQTQAWGISTLEEAQNLAINKGVTHRDNEEDMAAALGNGRAAIISKARLLHWDNDTTRIQLAKFASDFHSGVLNAYLQDGSLKASEYYEAHKEELMPQAQKEYLGKVKNNKLNYIARSSAERLYSLYSDNESGAYEEIDKIENEQERQAVENRLTALYNRQRRIENHEQDQLMDTMWEKVAEKLKSGQIPSEDDIPYGLNGRNWYNAQNAINQLVNKGDIDTDNSAYLELYELRNTDAQKFANMNLTQYRSLLSNSDYKAFQKMQVDIKNMTPTQLTDQDNAIKNGLKALGYSYNKQGQLETDPSWYFGEKTELKAQAFENSANAYIRELELKKGKNLTQGEIAHAMKEFAQNYAYKNKDKEKIKYTDKKGKERKLETDKASDLYIAGMNHQVNFMRNVLNDFQTAAKEKGSALTDEEKYKIVAERVSKTVLEENKELSRKTAAMQGSMPHTGDMWNGHRITSTYGKREKPIKGASTFHKGVDLAYQNNEPFNAFASGKVVKVAYDAGYGNYVDIESEDGTIHRYAHANSICVKKDQEVTASTRLGRAGSTGISTGAHLHYEKIVNGKSIDPLNRNENKTMAKNSAYAEGTIIKNPNTGKRLVMRGGKWQTI